MEAICPEDEVMTRNIEQHLQAAGWPLRNFIIENDDVEKM